MHCAKIYNSLEMDAKKDVVAQDGASPQKRPYVAPKLETLGSIRELTRGSGMSGNPDTVHPPGLNKSAVS